MPIKACTKQSRNFKNSATKPKPVAGLRLRKALRHPISSTHGKMVLVLSFPSPFRRTFYNLFSNQRNLASDRRKDRLRSTKSPRETTFQTSTKSAAFQES